MGNTYIIRYFSPNNYQQNNYQIITNIYQTVEEKRQRLTLEREMERVARLQFGDEEREMEREAGLQFGDGEKHPS